MPTDDVEPDQAGLFEWLDLLMVAVARRAQRDLTSQVVGVAGLVALTSKGTTGRGAYVDAARLAAEIGKSERQVWRNFRTAVDLGWFEQTHLPKRPKAGEKGQRARYRLTLPALDLSSVRAADGVTPQRVATSRRPASHHGPCDTSDTDRLTLSAGPSDATDSEVGTDTASVGTASVGTPSHPSHLPQLQDQREDSAMDGSPQQHVAWSHTHEAGAVGDRCMRCGRLASDPRHRASA